VWQRRPAVGLEGKTVCIVGDISRSRVARSNMHLLPLMGARVRVAGPPTMMPTGLEQYGVEAFDDIDACLDTRVDAVMMLRVQKERAAAHVMASDADYARGWGLTRDRWARVRARNAGALVMHPGPMNRGVEIDAAVADDAQSVILQQTENGVAVRMAVLYLLAHAHAKAEAA
jgi:aspartate carbamoyltransferase catalytic subunit